MDGSNLICISFNPKNSSSGRFESTVDVTKIGDLNQVKALIANGADVNTADLAGNPPLICAAKFGHIECVRTLLERGAFINSQCIKKCSPLMWAADNGHTEIVKVLIDNGAALNAKDFYGWTALMKAVYRWWDRTCLKWKIDPTSMLRIMGVLPYCLLQKSRHKPRYFYDLYSGSGDWIMSGTLNLLCGHLTITIP